MGFLIWFAPFIMFWLDVWLDAFGLWMFGWGLGVVRGCFVSVAFGWFASLFGYRLLDGLFCFVVCIDCW